MVHRDGEDFSTLASLTNLYFCFKTKTLLLNHNTLFILYFHSFVKNWVVHNMYSRQVIKEYGNKLCDELPSLEERTITNKLSKWC